MIPVCIGIPQSKDPGLWKTLEKPGPQARRTLGGPGPSKGQDPKGPRTIVDSGSEKTTAL